MTVEITIIILTANLSNMIRQKPHPREIVCLKPVCSAKTIGFNRNGTNNQRNLAMQLVYKNQTVPKKYPHILGIVGFQHWPPPQEQRIEARNHGNPARSLHLAIVAIMPGVSLYPLPEVKRVSISSNFCHNVCPFYIYIILYYVYMSSFFPTVNLYIYI